MNCRICYQTKKENEKKNPGKSIFFFSLGSLQELERHIENIKTKFGSFIPAKFKVGISAENMNHHLMNMIPGAFNGNPSMINTNYKQSTSTSTSTDGQLDTDESNDFGGYEGINVEQPSYESTTDDGSPMEFAQNGKGRKRKQNDQSEAQTIEAMLKKKKKVHICELVAFEPKYQYDDDDNEDDDNKNDDIQDGTVGTSSRSQNQKIRKSSAKRTNVKQRGTPMSAIDASNASQPNFIDALVRKINVIQENKIKDEKQLKKLQQKKSVIKIKIQKHIENMRELRHQMDMAKNALACIACKTPFNGPFFCSEQCKN